MLEWMRNIQSRLNFYFPKFWKRETKDANGKIVETASLRFVLTSNNLPKHVGVVFFMSLRDTECKNICEMDNANAKIGLENPIGEEIWLVKVNENKKRKRKLKKNYSRMV